MSVFSGIVPPKLIYKTESKYNGVIEVYEGKDGTRKIVVDGYNQSICTNSRAVRKRVWGKMVSVLKKNEPSAKRVLVLGLGGGTMQQLIFEDFPGVKLVSVEIDSEMVDIAKKFFDLDRISNHKVIVNDACRVVVEPEKFGLEKYSFDAVIVDIFAGGDFPDLGDSGNFLANLRYLAKPKGSVLFNRIYLKRHQEDVDNFIELLENFYTDVKHEMVAGHTNSDNVIVYCRSQ